MKTTDKNIVILEYLVKKEPSYIPAQFEEIWDFLIQHEEEEQKVLLRQLLLSWSDWKGVLNKDRIPESSINRFTVNQLIKELNTQADKLVNELAGIGIINHIVTQLYQRLQQLPGEQEKVIFLMLFVQGYTK